MCRKFGLLFFVALFCVVAAAPGMAGEKAVKEPATPFKLASQAELAAEHTGEQDTVAPEAEPLDLLPDWQWVSSSAPVWRAEVDAIFLHRSSVDETLVIDAQTGQELLNASDLDLEWAPGLRVDVARQLGCGVELQAVYFGIDGWAETASAADYGNLKVPIFVDRNFVVDTIDARYGSDLYSLEFNVRWPVARGRRALALFGNGSSGCGGCGGCGECCRPWLTAYAGFRWIELRENAYFESSFTEGIDPFLWGNFDVDNHLHGAQIGAEAIVWDNGGPLAVEVFSNVGIYGNRVNRAAYATGDLGARGLGDNGEHTAFVGEIAVKASCYLTDNWAGVVGYDLLWIDGVALAPIQKLAPLEATGTIVYGTAFYHGVFVGLEGKF